jgi:transposase IS116/IS110/IS902 family protein
MRPPADDDSSCRATDRSRFCRRNRRSFPHPSLARRRHLSRLGPLGRYQSGAVDYVGSISKCGDRRVRTLLCEAANVMPTRYKGQLKLKDWAFSIARRSSMRKARVALARRLAIIMHAMLRDGTEFVAAWAQRPQRQETASSSRKERRPREEQTTAPILLHAVNPWLTAISTKPPCTQLTASSAKRAPENAGIVTARKSLALDDVDGPA